MSLTSKLTTIAAAGSGGETALFILSLYGTINLYLNDITTDSSGNIIAVGSARDTVSSGNSDALNLKLDTNGNILFSDLTGKSSADYFYGVSVDSSGNIYSVGSIYDPTLSKNQGYIRKVSSDNTLLWEKRIYSSSKIVVLRDCDLSSDESKLFIGGSSTGNTAATAFYYGSVNTSDGTGLNDQYEQYAYSVICRSVAADSSGTSAYFGGIAGVTSPSNNSMDFLKRQAQSNVAASQGETFPFGGQSGAFVRDIAHSGSNTWLTVSGNRAWFFKMSAITVVAAKILNTASQARGVATDSSGNVYFLAYTSGSTVRNANIFKFDSSFNLQWTRRLKASSTTRIVNPERIAISDDDESIFVCGRENAQTDGVYSGFVFKFPTDGSLTGTYGNLIYESVTLPLANASQSSRTHAGTLVNAPLSTNTPTTTTLSFTPTSILEEG